MNDSRFLAVGAAAAMLLTAWTSAASAEEEATLRATLPGGVVEGTLLGYDQRLVLLLARDGQMWKFQPREATKYERLPTAFRSYSFAELRARLLREFGPSFDVTAAGHYLVVHPQGQKDAWATRYDQLYRSFIRYFTSRGVRTARPRFPLVAVVLPDRRTFERYAHRDNAQLASGVPGYYSTYSNRIIQYDVSSEGAAWQLNNTLIIHEASHQVAFNTGVHHRGSPPPRWVAEGLGTLFEAPGVWNSAAATRDSDRINRLMLKAWARERPGRPAGWTAEVIGTDRVFQEDMDRAYAESWALTYFLSETEPLSWARYLQRTSRLDRPAQVRGPERLEEFLESFGPDLQLLEARYLRFLEETVANHLKDG